MVKHKIPVRRGHGHRGHGYRGHRGFGHGHEHGFGHGHGSRHGHGNPHCPRMGNFEEGLSNCGFQGKQFCDPHGGPAFAAFDMGNFASLFPEAKEVPKEEQKPQEKPVEVAKEYVFPEVRNEDFENKLNLLERMGFGSRDLNLLLLKETNGDFAKTVELLLALAK